MTTIAVRDGVMAADSQFTTGNLKLTASHYYPKIARLKDGGLLAGRGSADDDGVTIAWLEGGCEDEGPALDASTEFLWLQNDGSLWMISGSPARHYRIGATFFAIGSGGPVAMTAMHLGKSAAEAVATACELDAYSGFPVQVEKLGPPPKPKRRK